MRIQGVVDNDIYPPRFGGAQRTFGLYRGLARQHDVSVLCVVPLRSRGAADERACGVRMRRHRVWYTAAAWHAQRLGVAPLWIAARVHAMRARAWRKRMEPVADVFAADFGMSGLLATERAALRVYLSQNVEADFFAANAGPLAGRAGWARALERFERRAVETADIVVVVSEQDRDRLHARYGTPLERVEVVPNGYDETQVSVPAPQARARARAALGVADDEYVALFVGSDHRHNREAAGWLANELAPRVREQRVRIVIAGAVGAALRTRATNVTVTGEVDDLAPLLHAADAGLNPIDVGAGSNVKLPTYLAAGLATLTTPFGLRGYPGLRPHVTLVEREGFASALAGRPHGWPAHAATLPVEIAELSWSALGARLGVALERSLRVARPVGSSGAAA